MTRLLNYNFQTFCRQIVFLVWLHHLPERHGRPPAVACLEPPPGNLRNVPMIDGTQPNTISENRYLLYNNISMLSTTFQYHPTMARMTMATMMMAMMMMAMTIDDDDDDLDHCNLRRSHFVPHSVHQVSCFQGQQSSLKTIVMITMAIMMQLSLQLSLSSSVFLAVHNSSIGLIVCLSLCYH